MSSLNLDPPASHRIAPHGEYGILAHDGLCSKEEARMTVSMKRILAAVYPPENTAALVILAMAIVDKMEGNPYFPNPIPTLANVTAAIDALRQAEAVSQSRMRGTVEVRNEARRRAQWCRTWCRGVPTGFATGH
ncbi:MAG TPA: hypothetical protein VN894_01405 [Polyangiaceae bacterium]|nr:hypothetical protein [Polyangiaceae bacterium]